MTQPTHLAVGAPPGGNTATTSIAAEPAGAASGTIIEAILLRDPGLGAITAPASWTQIGTAITLTDSEVTAWWIRRGGSAPALNWTWSGSASYSEVWTRGTNGAIATGNPIDSFTFGTPQTTGTVVTPPPVSILSVDTLVSAWAVNWLNGYGTPTAPSGYTFRGGGGGFDCVVSTKGTSATGTETPGAYGASAGSSPNVGLTIVIASQAGGAAAASDDPRSAARRQIQSNAVYRMSPQAQREAQQFLRAQKRSYGFASACE